MSIPVPDKFNPDKPLQRWETKEEQREILLTAFEYAYKEAQREAKSYAGKHNKQMTSVQKMRFIGKFLIAMSYEPKGLRHWK